MISSEEKGILVSLSIVWLGNIIKPQQRDVGNMVQGLGLGGLIGTVLHQIDQEFPSHTPHHDITSLISLPLIFMLDKANIIKNEDVTNNLYGIGIGVLSEHLLAEGCSFCGTIYCKNGKKLC